jgi:hypothetical protein
MAYRTKISKLAAKYEHRGLWHLIYQADCRMRHEHMERLRRQGARAKHRDSSHEFDPAFPWKWVWMEASQDVQFWKAEFEDPAFEVLTRLASLSSTLGGDAAIAGASGGSKRQSGDDLHHDDAPAPKEARRTPPPPPQQAIADRPPKKEKNGGTDKSQQSGGRYTHNRKGIEICNLYNEGNCYTKGSTCAKGNRVHQCNLCLAVHPGSTCSKVVATEKKKGGKRGGGKKW